MTRVLPPTADGIAEAAALLRAGRLVAFGTETVYGLGARADDPSAVAAIYAAKARPSFNPLICHYSSLAAAADDVVIGSAARKLAAAFWPGPLTLVMPSRPGARVAPAACAGLDTLAIRVPAHPAALRLLELVGIPVAAPSANRSGRVSPTTATHVLDGLDGRIDAVLDTGPCRVGLESTVVDLSGPHAALLRPGGITAERIVDVLGTLAGAHGAVARSPGQLGVHYAPVLPLRVDATECCSDEALLAFGPAPPAPLVFQLSARADPDEAAARLFGGLRWLDHEAKREGLRGIAAMPVPPSGLGAAINDRLRRAARQG